MAERFQRTPATLTIHTASDDQPEIEDVEQHQAQLYESKHKNFLIYEETVEEGGTIQCTIIFTDDEVKILRHGVIEMNQVYKVGEPVTGTYRTPFGKFNMETTTHTCHIVRKNNEGNITLMYDVKLNGQHMGQRTVRMHFQTAE